MDSAISKDPRFRYDDERTILLSEIWHKNRTTLYERLITPPFEAMGSPQSILKNGGTYH